MPNENNKISKYNSGEKSLKVPFIIYVDLECLLEKIDTCQNNQNKSYMEKKAKHKPSGYSIVTCCSFNKSKTERNYYRGKECMKRFCKDLRNQATKIVNYEKKSNEFVIYVKKNFVLIKVMKKNLNYTIKSEIIVIIQKNLEGLSIIVAI